ncbi:19400_t:CDS:2 [Cetraspora pellucida]|uniref:19400_t:CDS:1 n=1 Tax=Cetraspora pellucida TaxID=1433469 RepID=A0A9N9BSY5_9GLOM|nr:19400_t:CDS:2 [Cetraspora pellucida]
MLTELATTNNSSDEQIQMIAQEDLLPDTEVLLRDELVIYSYRTSYSSTSCIPKAVSLLDKNKKQMALS